MELVIYTTLLILFSVYGYLIFRHDKYAGKLPPGTMGLPIIGHTLQLTAALRDNKVREWFQDRIQKYGPISKAHLFGYPTIVLHGPAANKFVFNTGGNILANKQPKSITRILGLKNIFELMGDDHKRVRVAIMSFLRIEVLKQHVSKVDKEIQHHLRTYWHGKRELQVQHVVRMLTFNVISAILIGVTEGPRREKLLPLLHDMIEGVLSVPINLPFTRFSRGIVASRKIRAILVDLMREKREELGQKKIHHQKDLITSFLSMPNEDGSTMMSDEEIIDNIIVAMVAGFDTTSILLTFFIRLLANNKSIYSTLLQEHEEIAKGKAPGEALTWEDLTKMKYTWRVASEILRINPPINLNFRRAMKDIEHEGYIIPKGWQVMVSASMTHMDDNIFHNSAIFDPSRFEKSGTPSPPFTFVAFGAGPRICPGFELAKMEASTMIHHLMTRFTWELVKKDESFKCIPMPEFDQGLLVRITSEKETLVSSKA